MNLYVIDDATRAPVSGATVRVGSVDGTTDATGLFVANGLVGPQTVAVKATSYKSEVWIGANGANMTFDLKPAVDPAPTSASVSGAITGFSSLVVPAGHHRTAVISYSQSDKATDAQNNLATANNTNICDTALPNGACTFTVTSRAGHVALFAAIYDHDTLNTPNPADDTYTPIAWATRTGLTVTDGAALTGQDLTLVDVGNIANVTVDFGSPPSGLATVAGLPGIDLGADGIMQLAFVTPAKTMVLVPKASAFTGATYRLTAIAENGTDPKTSSQSIILERSLPGPMLAAGTWIAPPVGLSLTRTGGSWTALSGAIVQSADYDQGTTHLLSVTVFDGSTSFTIPDLVALPGTGTLDAKASALAGDLDVTSFAIDTDITKIRAVSAQPMTIN